MNKNIKFLEMKVKMNRINCATDFKITNKKQLSIGDAYAHLYTGGILVTEKRNAYKLSSNRQNITRAVPISVHHVRWYKCSLLCIKQKWFKGEEGQCIPDTSLKYINVYNDTHTNLSISIKDNIISIEGEKMSFDIRYDLSSFWVNFNDII